MESPDLVAARSLFGFGFGFLGGVGRGGRYHRVCGAGGHGRWGCGCAFCVSSGRVFCVTRGWVKNSDSSPSVFIGRHVSGVWVRGVCESVTDRNTRMVEGWFLVSDEHGPGIMFFSWLR